MFLLYKRRQKIAFSLLIFFLLPSGITPVIALTTGPSSPEFNSFTSIGSSEMVDPFTGDFSYSIPLFDLPGPNGGYPFTLSYAAGSGMDEEASWVGLGWNLSSGAINRQLRGYPDEFQGDTVFNTVSMVPNVTVGIEAGLGIEVLGRPVEEEFLKGGFGLGFYNNTLNGPGYTLSADIGLSSANRSPQIGGNFGINFDSNEGGRVGAGFSYGNESAQFGFRGYYSSKSGLNSISLEQNYQLKYGEQGVDKSIVEGSISTPYLTFVHPSYFPQNPFPMTTSNFSAVVKGGVGVFGVFGHIYLSGYYSESKFKHDKIRIGTPAFGYSNLQNVNSQSEYLIDLNREKDGMINNFSPNLAVPHLTYDLFNVSAFGIGGTFRPYRNDFGLTPESQIKSNSISVSGGAEFGASGHFAMNLTPAYSENKSGFWANGADFIKNFFFSKASEHPGIPPVSYSFIGDRNQLSQNLFDKTGGLDPVNIQIEQDLIGYKMAANKQGYSPDLSLPFGQKMDIKTRRNIIPLINEEILKNDTSLISELNIQYFDRNNNLLDFDRSNFPKHHVAGYIITAENGLRYTFGLPVYNLVQEEYNFSTDSARTQDRVFTNVAAVNNVPNFQENGTKEYYKKTEIPKFAYSYLLTSIQGNNYVDVYGDGISADDLGYWVKFSYQKITDSNNVYKWRDPYTKAHYIEGYATDVRDDMGTFSYGEKEIYYLKQAETRSHIAKFFLNTEERLDAKGANNRFQDDASQLGLSVKNLKNIVLYTRAGGETVPLKNIKFQYDYSLSGNVPNSVGNTGKLTLKQLIVENGGSTLGSQNPYKFQYSAFNPGYSQESKDRWGNYKPIPASGESNLKWPYVNQDNQQLQDQYAGAWNMTRITLPSGGIITVDYEADRYAYVQQEKASEMVKFSMAGVESGNRLVYSYNPESTVPKIRFSLNESIPGTLSTNDQRLEVLKYLDVESKEVFVKLDVNLRKTQENLFETIEGYLKINLNAPMTLIADGSGNYVQGEFELEKVKNVHPFAAMAWQHIELNQPWIANVTKNFANANSNSERLSLIKGLVGIVGAINQTFSNFDQYCQQRQWGQQINLKMSGVRLTNADGKKIGGGHRVRQITIHDNWLHDAEGYYGQVYDYTQVENGNVISSGVSSFEPFVGGEENSLRKSKSYKEVRKLKSDANLYFEYPVNESLYPAPVVGYSEVKILSLPAAKKAGYTVLGNAVFPTGSQATYGTTGMKKLTFFTAKDFPTIPLETEIKKGISNVSLFPNPFIKVQVNNLTASQGYGIILNNMHGKAKSEEAFSQTINGGFVTEPISWTKYRYKSDVKIEGRKKVSTLSSLFSSMGNKIISLASGQGEGEDNIYFGYQSDFIVDVREIVDNTSSIGFSANVDFILGFIPFPVPTKFNNAVRVENRLKTVVTNKIIYQQGILESVESSNLGSKLLTEQLRWDLLTGSPVLQRLNNNFEAPIYQLSTPAYHVYMGMGPAQENNGYKFLIPVFSESSDKPNEFLFNPSFESTQNLRKGDEILLYQNAEDLLIPLAKVVYLGVVNGDMRIFSPHEDLSNHTNLNAKVFRSGNRNVLSATTKTIVGLEIPESGEVVIHSKSVLLPVPQKID